MKEKSLTVTSVNGRPSVQFRASTVPEKYQTWINANNVLFAVTIPKEQQLPHWPRQRKLSVINPKTVLIFMNSEDFTAFVLTFAEDFTSS